MPAAPSGPASTDMNSASIGIEIVNGGHDFGLPAFPEVADRRRDRLVHRYLSAAKHPAGSGSWPTPISPRRENAILASGFPGSASPRRTSASG